MTGLTFTRFALVTAIVLAVGCGKDQTSGTTDLQEGTAMSEAGTQAVRAANGTLYAVSCLKTKSAEIQAKGASALAACKMDPKTGEGRNFISTGSYYYIYYPPTYYAPTTYSYYYSPTTTYNYNNNYSYNNFCSYVLGGATNYNCYQLFGYTQKHTQYYDNSCGYCLNSYYPNQCRNRCWSGNVWAY